MTQRGVRRMDVFFCDADRLMYLDLLRRFAAEHGLAVWGYCLMTNHVHLVGVPEGSESLAKAVGRTHWHYTRAVNFREGWRGYLWQGRFGSCALDEYHALAALRYVELNPVRAGIVETPEAWGWSSARGHVTGEADAVLTAAPIIPSGAAWRRFLSDGIAEAELRALRVHARTGRPLGAAGFVERIGGIVGRSLAPAKRGPKAGSHWRRRRKTD